MNTGPTLLHDVAFLFLLLAIAVLLAFTAAFIAAAIWLRRENARRAARWNDLETRWRPLIVQALAGAVEPEQVREHVAADERPYFIDLVYRYAQRVSGAERERASRLVEPFLDWVAARIREARDPEQRARALQTVSLFAPERYERETLAALDDPAPLVAMVAARSIAHAGRGAHARAVLERLPRFESWSSHYLVSLLTAFGSDIAPALRDALADPERPAWIRAVAARALRRLHDPAAGDVAADVLSTATDTDLLSSALELLATVGTAEHLPGVRAHCSSGDAVVRAHATAALAALGDGNDRHRLWQAFDDESNWVAIRAAAGLVRFGEVEPLIRIATSDHPRATLARQALADA